MRPCELGVGRSNSPYKGGCSHALAMLWPALDVDYAVPVPCLQIKVKKADNDLLIEQLRQVFRVLAVDKVPVAKLDKRLDDVTHKWDDIKKLQPQVKNNVEPVQVGASCVLQPRWLPAETADWWPQVCAMSG